MTKALHTLKLDPDDATLERVAKILQLKTDELDRDFGVVLIDPKNSLYSVLVEDNALARLGDAGDLVEGPFSNPRIETFGPPLSNK